MSPETPRPPSLEFQDCQEPAKAIPFRLSEIASRATTVLSHLLVEVPPGPEGSCYPEIEEGPIEISWVSDSEIARIHGEFLADPTPTDVITFHHGELIVSVDTAAREAADREETVERELLLYVIHGLLHLHGYDDHSPEDRDTMWAYQTSLIEQVWSGNATPTVPPNPSELIP